MEKLRADGSKIGAPTGGVKIQETMFNTPADFLNALMKKKGFTSDYQIGKHYKISAGRISNYRNERHSFDLGMCQLIERELGIAAGTVAAWSEGYKARHYEDRLNYWNSVAKSLLAAAAIASSGGTNAAAAPAPASHNNQSIHIM